MNSEKDLKNSKKYYFWFVMFSTPKSITREKSRLPFSHLRTSANEIFNSTWRNLVFVRNEFAKVFWNSISWSFFKCWKTRFFNWWISFFDHMIFSDSEIDMVLYREACICGFEQFRKSRKKSILKRSFFSDVFMFPTPKSTTAEKSWLSFSDFRTSDGRIFNSTRRNFIFGRNELSKVFQKST